MIRPSRRLTKRHGAKHVKYIMYERSDTILQQVYLQMSAKCVDKSFKKSKEELRSIREDLPTIFGDLYVVKEEEWVLVDDANDCPET